MGKALADKYPVAKAIFKQADEALDFPISHLCFDGPDDQLRLTQNTQPAILTVSIAAFAVLTELGHQPTVVAGHSLGEYSALVAAGALEFADAVRLVRKRGQYMQEAVPAGVGAMAAILKPPLDQLDSILAAAAQGEIVSAANFNSPDQMVIAGHAGAVARACEALKAAGAKRTVPLPVSAPFHCALMRPAQQRLLADLEATHFSDLRVPLINNISAAEVRTGADARQSLYLQVPGAVLWADSMRGLASRRIHKAVEVGVGAVLCGLMRQIEPNVKMAKFGEPADLEKLNELVS